MNKKCNRCGQIKNLDSFSKNTHGMKDGHLNQCKLCVLIRVRDWKSKNPERVIAERKLRYVKDRIKNNKRALEWSRNNKERRKEIKRKWTLKNRELLCHLSKNRSYREKGAIGSHTLAEYNNKLQEFKGMCAYCNVRKANTKDHVIPLSRGGTNFISNILPACVSCNSSKGTKLLLEWVNRIYLNK